MLVLGPVDSAEFRPKVTVFRDELYLVTSLLLVTRICSKMNSNNDDFIPVLKWYYDQKNHFYLFFGFRDFVY